MIDGSGSGSWSDGVVDFDWTITDLGLDKLPDADSASMCLCDVVEGDWDGGMGGRGILDARVRFLLSSS